MKYFLFKSQIFFNKLLIIITSIKLVINSTLTSKDKDKAYQETKIRTKRKERKQPSNINTKN